VKKKHLLPKSHRSTSIRGKDRLVFFGLRVFYELRICRFTALQVGERLCRSGATFSSSVPRARSYCKNAAIKATAPAAVVGARRSAPFGSRAQLATNLCQALAVTSTAAKTGSPPARVEGAVSDLVIIFLKKGRAA
jgi:hypothetical protein